MKQAKIFGFKFLSKVAVLLILVSSLNLVYINSALASIRTLEEAPGQMLYQSRQTLKDLEGKAWQVIFFKRTFVDREPEISLRLVGFPENTEFLHPHDLRIMADEDIKLTAEDIFAKKSPGPNVGQYNFREVLSKLPPTSFIRLELPLNQKQAPSLKVPYFLLQEWQKVANS